MYTGQSGWDLNYNAALPFAANGRICAQQKNETPGRGTSPYSEPGSDKISYQPHYIPPFQEFNLSPLALDKTNV